MPFFRSKVTFSRWRNIRADSALRAITIRHATSQSAPSLTTQEVDAKWRGIWGARQASPSSTGSATKQKSYILSMFPYPSGTLHMGHLRVYTISDVLARYKQMKGFEVLHPMGWDAFGLPAENAAIERGIDPAVWTEKNIATMKEQLIGMNGMFDWSQEFRTCSPSFYKHTQRIFLMLHKRKLAYQAEAMVNYDPIDKTVLANEQVDANGRSWRSGAIVEQLKLKQWFFRITAFKEALLEDLNALTVQGRWPERVVLQQRHWLGKSVGAKLDFAVQKTSSVAEATDSSPAAMSHVEVFTTRPDTVFGVTYIALSCNHPLVQQAAVKSPQLKSFLEQANSAPSDSKFGFRLPHLSCVNPLSFLPALDDTNYTVRAPLPVYVAPYVLDDYGSGAVMGVPAHDSRDLAFWRGQASTNPVPIVISPMSEAEPMNLIPEAGTLHEPYTGQGKLTSICGPYAGLENEQASKLIVEDLKASGNSSAFVENWRLRDWLVSRQRYWGTPIPIVHCEKCGAVPVPEDQLPVTLPPLEKLSHGQSGNPLQNIESWVNTNCPTCGGAAKRDTDTMDTFVDSSWYFMRFPDAQNDKELVSKDLAERMLPVDTYLGGVEHAILHLLYARFMYKFLASEGLAPASVKEGKFPAEPFRQLISQGMVHGKTFSDPVTGRFLRPEEVDGSDTLEPLIKATGMSPTITWEKMSKSKYNGVDPLECISKFGADATRAHILFAAPVSEVLDWDEEKIVGIERWFLRIRRLVSLVHDDDSFPALTKMDLAHRHSLFRDGKICTMVDFLSDEDVQMSLQTHNIIESISSTFERNLYALNTTISDLIKLTNAIVAILPKSQPTTQNRKTPKASQPINAVQPAIVYYALSALVRMLAPIAPAFAEESWETLHMGRLATSDSAPSIFDSEWPESVLDVDLVARLSSRRKTMTCAVQVNGKLRFSIDIPASSTADISGDGQYKTEQEYLAEKLLESEQGKYWLREKNDWEKRKRMIVVQGGKVVNVVF